MKRAFTFAWLALAAGLSSCEPQAFTMNVEMRYPSPSGLDLAGKSMSVVYVDDTSGADYDSAFANSFASSLEKEYFGGNQVIDVYRMDRKADAAYGSKDTLVNFLMDSNDDVVFLLDVPRLVKADFAAPRSSSLNSPDSADVVKATQQFFFSAHVYDALNPKDSVYSYNRKAELTPEIYTPANAPGSLMQNILLKSLGKETGKVGTLFAKSFYPVWKPEQFVFIYFESPEIWITAAENAYNFKWKEAVDLWIKAAKVKAPMKKSCAAFNIAQACYITGEYDLARKWLDISDKEYPISLSKELRNRIAAK